MNESLKEIVDEIKLECQGLHKESGLCYHSGEICPWFEILKARQVPNCDLYAIYKVREMQ